MASDKDQDDYDYAMEQKEDQRRDDAITDPVNYPPCSYCVTGHCILCAGQFEEYCSCDCNN